MSKSHQTLLASFLLSFLFSFLIMIIIVLFFSHSQTIDNSKFFYSVVPWARTGVFKTYDFRNYLIGIGIFSLSPLIFYFLINRQKQLIKFFKKNKFLIIILAIFLFFFFLLILNKVITHFHFPTIGEINIALGKRRGVELKKNIIYLPLVLFTITVIYWLIKIKAVDRWLFKINNYLLSINNFLKNKIYFNYLMILLIFFLIFNPRYQYSFEKLANYGGEAIHQFHHTNFFIGPINEVINGKTLLVNAHSQYGLLLTYFPALIFKFIGLSYAGFTLYNILLSIIYAIAFYFVLTKILNNRLLGILGVLGYVKLVFFRNFFPKEIFIFPSSTPIRYFFDIIVIYLIFKLFEKDEDMRFEASPRDPHQRVSVPKNVISSLFLSISFFYNTEIGISLIFAYLSALFFVFVIFNLKKNKHFSHFPISQSPSFLISQSLNLLISLFIFIFFYFFIFLFLSLFSYLKSGYFLNWLDLFTPLFFFQKGFFDVGMPLIGPWYFIAGIYLATYYLLLFKWFKKDKTNFSFLVFLLIYGIFSFFYYIGLSEPHHLATILHPAIILFFILLNEFFKNIQTIIRLPIIYKTIIVSFFVIVFGYIFWTPNSFAKNIALRIKERYFPLAKNYYYWPYPGTNFFLSDNDGKDFAKAVGVIKKYNRDQKSVFILSRYDTLLLVMSQKASLFDYFIIEYDTGPTIKSYNDLIKKIIHQKPRYIFVRSQKYSYVFNDSIPGIWKKIKKYYVLVENGGAIDVYNYDIKKLGN